MARGKKRTATEAGLDEGPPKEDHYKASFDLWAEGDVTSRETKKRNVKKGFGDAGRLSEEQRLSELVYINAPNPSYRKRSYAPASRRSAAPAPGLSYNPDEQTANATMEKAAKMLKAQNKKILRLKNARKIRVKARESRCGMQIEEPNSDDSDAGESTAKVGQAERKTRVQRNKEAKVQREHFAHVRKQREKKLNKMFDNWEEILEEHKVEMVKKGAKFQRKKEAKRKKLGIKVKRLGADTWRPSAPAVLPPSATTGSLRTQAMESSGIEPATKERLNELREKNMVSVFDIKDNRRGQWKRRVAIKENRSVPVQARPK